MSNPTWSYLSLPLIGLAGLTVNSTPPLTPAPSVTANGQCTSTFGACDQSNWNPVCSNLSCPDGQTTGSCSCVNGQNSCDPNFVCTMPFTCTKTCQQLNPANACPQGTYIPPPVQGGNALCSYTPTQTNIQWIANNSGFPQPFITGIVQRYAISQYVAEWNTQLFEDTNGTSLFHNLNYTDAGQETLFRNNLQGKTLSNLPPIPFLTGVPPPGNQYIQNFSQMLGDAVMYPQLIYSLGNSGGSFSMLFYTYDAPFIVNPQGVDISAYLQSFTMERPSQVQNLAPILGNPTNIPAFGLPQPAQCFPPYLPVQFGGLPCDLLTNKYYIFVDLTTYKVYNVNVPETQLQTIQQVRTQPGLAQDDFYIIGRIYSVPVAKLSPVLTYLFSKAYANLPFDTLGAGGLCDKIKNDTTQIPAKCFTNTCVPNFSADCKSIMSTYCQIQSIPNQYPALSGSTGPVNHFFLTSNGGDCQCIDTQLPPPVIGGIENLPGMCFTSFCTKNPELMTGFGLTDQYCSKYCGQINDWLTNPDPSKRSAFPEYLDAGQYERLCGAYAPTKAPANYYVLSGGAVISLGVGVIAFLISKSIGLGLGLFLGIFAIGIYLAFDLNGTSVCTPTGSSCQSSISHIPIPNWFCSYSLGCECGIGKSCPTGDTCVAGICIPPSSDPLIPIQPPPAGGSPQQPQSVNWQISSTTSGLTGDSREGFEQMNPYPWSPIGIQDSFSPEFQARGIPFDDGPRSIPPKEGYLYDYLYD